MRGSMMKASIDQPVLKKPQRQVSRPTKQTALTKSGLRPEDVYLPSTQPYDGLPGPFHDRDILVTACGRICMHRKRINISTVLAGQKLRIKDVDDGIWLVSFINYDLGYIDLEQRTLQPLDNPFGPRVSPMS